MNMMRVSENNGSFVTDILRLVGLHNIDLVQVIVSQELPLNESAYPEIPEDTYNTLLNSFELCELMPIQEFISSR